MTDEHDQILHNNKINRTNPLSHNTSPALLFQAQENIPVLELTDTPTQHTHTYTHYLAIVSRPKKNRPVLELTHTPTPPTPPHRHTDTPYLVVGPGPCMYELLLGYQQLLPLVALLLHRGQLLPNLGERRLRLLMLLQTVALLL